mmetsp:Transcript_11529/g.70907  ORF Transcript_11529/g.70907 Transcript_11529/m.70907 type:complete len:1193 (-) Transcript_11529:902-4480(-)
MLDGNHEAEELLYCAARNVSYYHRVVNEDHNNFCSVPESGADAILLAAIAVAVACVLRGKLSAVWLLLAGMATQLLAYAVNTRQLGNATVLWTSAQPPEIFYFIFLPALLFESASNLDFFIFKKVLKKVFAFAIALVFVQTGLTAFSLVYLLDLKRYGWTLEHGLLMGATLSMTDAVAVNSVLATTDAPEELGVVLEGESLLNDASGFVLFSMFLKYATKDTPLNARFVFTEALRDMVVLGAGGAVVGALFGLGLIYLLNLMRRAGLKKKPEVSLSVAIAYLCFYVAQGPAGFSGPIAVVVNGLLVNAIGKAELSPAVQNLWHWSWELLAYMANSIIFFFAGIAAMNFVLFSGLQEDFDGRIAILYLPVIYVLLFAIRFVCICPIWLTSRLTSRTPNTAMTINDVVFLTFTALRGAMSLILGNEIILQKNIPGLVREQIVVWTAGFTLMTILINVPVLPWLFQLTGHTKCATGQTYLHKKAIISLHKFTSEVVESMLKYEVVKKADWLRVLDKALPNLHSVEKASAAVPSSDEDVTRPLLDVEDVNTWVEDEVRGSNHSFEGLSSFLFCNTFEEGVYQLALCEQPPDSESEQAPPGERLYEKSSSREEMLRDIMLEASMQKVAAEETQLYPSPFFADEHEDLPSLETRNMYGLKQQSESIEESHLGEMRARLVAGLKRYIYKKRTEGLLSANGLRWLSYALDKQLDAGGKLRVWTFVESQMSINLFIRLVNALYMLSRRLFKPVLKSKFGRWLVRRITRPLLGIINRRSLLSEEIASDYLLALKHGNHNRWLHEAPMLQQEVDEELASLRRYLEFAELESSDRTRAIHTYRATVAVLTQQLNFLEELFEGGMLKKNEMEQMMKATESKLQEVIAEGPDWKFLGLLGVLKGVPGFCRFSEDWLCRVLIFKGQLRTFEKGKLLVDGLTSDSRGCGISILLRGFLRNEWEDPQARKMYKSGVSYDGLISSITGSHPRSTRKIYSEGAMQQGTVIFHLSQDVVENFKSQAASGDPQMVQLMVDLHRLAAMEVVNLLKYEIDASVQRRSVLQPTSKLWQRAKQVAEAKMSERMVEGREEAGIGESETLNLTNILLSLLEDAAVVRLSPGQQVRFANHVVLLQGTLTLPEKGTEAKDFSVLLVKSNSEHSALLAEAGETGALIVACLEASNEQHKQSAFLPLPKGSAQFVGWSEHATG